jgi:hypothetical protein
MKKLLFVVLGIATVLALSPVAKADSFSYTFAGRGDPGLTGSFSFTTVDSDFTSAALEITTTTVDQPYFPVGTSTFVSGTYDGGGLGNMVFTLDGYTIDLFNIGTGWQLEESGADATDQFLTAEGGSVPEPPSVLLLGSGLFLGVGLILWSKGPHALKLVSAA